MALSYGTFNYVDPVLGSLTLTGDGFSAPGDLESLALNDTVQERLGMSEEQREAVKRLSDAYRAALVRHYADFAENEPAERSQRRARQVADEKAEFARKLAGVLSDEQYRRLKQLSWRIRDGESLLDEEVAGALGLTPAQRQQLRAAAAENEAAAREVQEALKRIRFEREEELAAFKAKYQQEARQRLLSVLTPEQSAAFDRLRGGTAAALSPDKERR